MTAAVEIDWTPVTRATAQLADGIDSGSRATTVEQATVTAAAIRAGVPRLTGRLAASVDVITETDAAAVTYGAGVPYAGKIERRTHTVATATADAERRFIDAERAVAEREVSRL